MSDGDWETFTNQPAKHIPGDKWEGEDEDDEVKDNWDDDDDEEKKEQSEQIKEIKTEQIKKKKIRQEKIAQKNREEQEAALTKIEKEVPLTPEQAFEEKLRQRQLQEESELELVKEAFGTNDIGKNGIDAMHPSSKEDFDEFENALKDKILNYEKSLYFIPFLEALFRGLCAGLEPEEIKKIGSSLNVLSSEKSKQLKVSKAKKKSKKATLVVDRGNYNFDDYGDEFEDFM